jgi:hypothetical protein
MKMQIFGFFLNKQYFLKNLQLLFDLSLKNKYKQNLLFFI